MEALVELILQHQSPAAHLLGGDSLLAELISRFGDDPFLNRPLMRFPEIWHQVHIMGAQRTGQLNLIK
jgi:hypothetical protein